MLNINEYTSQQVLATDMIKNMLNVLLDNQSLENALVRKSYADKLLSLAYLGKHKYECDGKESSCHDDARDLILDIILVYGGSISTKLLNEILGECKGFHSAIESLIEDGKILSFSCGKTSGFCLA